MSLHRASDINRCLSVFGLSDDLLYISRRPVGDVNDGFQAQKILRPYGFETGVNALVSG